MRLKKPLPQPPLRRLSGEAVRAGLAVVATVAGLVLLLQALTSDGPLWASALSTADERAPLNEPLRLMGVGAAVAGETCLACQGLQPD